MTTALDNYLDKFANATEMYMIASAYNTAQQEEAIKLLSDEIRTAASQGLMNIEKTEPLSQEIINILERKGYVVNVVIDVIDPVEPSTVTTITWDTAAVAVL